MKQQLHVNGMHGHHCEMIIENALKKENVTVQADAKNQIVEVEYDHTKQTIESIKEMIEDLGYDVK